MNNNQMDKAGEFFMIGYKRSLHEQGDYGSQHLMNDIEKLANKYRDSNNSEPGGKLLQDGLEISKASLGEDGMLTREWLMRLSTYFLLAGQRENARRVNQELIESVTKPGMSIAKNTADDLITLARLLRKRGYSQDAGKIERRLKEFESQQCGGTTSTTTVRAANRSRTDRSMADLGVVGFKFILTVGRPPTVQWVFPASPAALARLRSGDQILQIDGAQTNNLTKENIYDMLTGKPGTKVHLGMSRTNTPFDVTLTRVSVNEFQKLDPEIWRDYQRNRF
jgi:hypothetical protein